MNARTLAEGLGLDLPKSMPDHEVMKIVKGHMENARQREKERKLRQKENPVSRKIKAVVARFISTTYEAEKKAAAKMILNLAKGHGLKVRSIVPEAADHPRIDFDYSNNNPSPSEMKEEPKQSVEGKVLKRWSVIGGNDFEEHWIDKGSLFVPPKVKKWKACGLRVQTDIIEDNTEEEKPEPKSEFDSIDTTDLSDEYIMDRLEHLNHKVESGTVTQAEIVELGKLTFEKFQRGLNTIPKKKKEVKKEKKITRTSKFGKTPRRQRIMQLAKEGVYDRNSMAEVLIEEGYGTLKASLAAINGTLYDEKRKGNIHHWRTRDDKVIEVFESESDWKNREMM